MLIREIAPQKPLTPDQARVNALKNASDQAKERLKAERQRQKVLKAQKALQRATQPQTRQGISC
jgi:hypothetical protein